MKQIVFHPEAQNELRLSANWYHSQQYGLGAAFREEVEAAISRILAAPEAFGIIDDDIRCHLVHRFPYGILYQNLSDQIFIVAVMHLHREPDYWKSRKN